MQIRLAKQQHLSNKIIFHNN